MHFADALPPYPHRITPLGVLNTMTMSKHQSHRTRPWPAGFCAASKASPLQQQSDAAGCIEQLLVHCADAIEANDSTLAQQILWVLNNIAPPDGDTNQRLAASFLRALVSRAARNGTCSPQMLLTAMSDNTHHHQDGIGVDTHRFSIIELASFVDITPWHRFGFVAANSAIVEAIEGRSVVHVVDLSLTHCMQIPTLIEAFANRAEGPPIVKLTVAAPCKDDVAHPPQLDLPYDDLGTRLINFARSRNVIMEFRVIPSTPSDGFSSLLQQLSVRRLVNADEDEALVINCHMMLRRIPDETMYSSLVPMTSPRTMFLNSIRGLNPKIVLLVDEDADFTSNDPVQRLRSAYEYMWIPYDTVETFMAEGSKQREWYEAEIYWKIDNIVAQEGTQRVERAEPKCRWAQRMWEARFRTVSFKEEGVREIRRMLEEHSAGWGLKRDDHDVVLTWKGHNVVFATAWVPT